VITPLEKQRRGTELISPEIVYDMDLHTLKLYLQNSFTDGLLTIVGSGLSVAEGIPGMSDLALRLQEELPSMPRLKGIAIT
jgi:hypothetical protein